MSTLFESRVRERQQATPWVRIAAGLLLADLATTGEAAVQLTVIPRHEVASGLWWTLAWVSADGKQQTVHAQTFDTLLWRTAEVEVQARQGLGGAAEPGRGEAEEKSHP